MTPDHQTPLQELGERVAKLMGWRRAQPFLRWQHAGAYHHCPSDVTEWPRLMAEFNICVVFHGLDVDPAGYSVSASSMNGDAPVFIVVFHDNTPASRLEAATRAVLLAVEMILKNREG